MRNIKLTLAYDGSDFHGWQVQPGLPTIQGHLNAVLSRVTQENIFVHGAGRTDAGVHALGQVAHFRTVASLTPAQFLHALNALLPPAIRALSVEEVAPDFHARHSARGKTYRYRIFRGPVLPPFLHHYTLHVPSLLDEEAMMNAARLFEGEHDFTYFSASAEMDSEEGPPAAGPHPVRTVWESQILRMSSSAGSPAQIPAACADGELVYRIRGRSFLRYMVRKIAATLLDIGRGHLHASQIPALLSVHDRAKTAPTLPPRGLFLESVSYTEGDLR